MQTIKEVEVKTSTSFINYERSKLDIFFSFSFYFSKD